MDSTFLNQVGIITISSDSLIANQTSSGVPIGIRIFDICMAATGSTVASARFFNVFANGSTDEYPRLVVTDALSFLTSMAGWRFPNGCYCNLSGACTVTVNYSLEIT